MSVITSISDPMVSTLNIIYASINGNTEYVMGRIEASLRSTLPHLIIRRVRAEGATEKDFLMPDVLLLGSGTWNTSGVEGQLNPHMHSLLFEQMKGRPLTGKPMAFVSLGDEDHHFITDCKQHFLRFMKDAGGRKLLPSLVIVNDPYSQHENIDEWAEKFASALGKKKAA